MAVCSYEDNKNQRDISRQKQLADIESLLDAPALPDEKPAACVIMDVGRNYVIVDVELHSRPAMGTSC